MRGIKNHMVERQSETLRGFRVMRGIDGFDWLVFIAPVQPISPYNRRSLATRIQKILVNPKMEKKNELKSRRIQNKTTPISYVCVNDGIAWLGRFFSWVWTKATSYLHHISVEDNTPCCLRDVHKVTCDASCCLQLAARCCSRTEPRVS